MLTPAPVPVLNALLALEKEIAPLLAASTVMPAPPLWLIAPEMVYVPSPFTKLNAVPAPPLEVTAPESCTVAPLLLTFSTEPFVTPMVPP